MVRKKNSLLFPNAGGEEKFLRLPPGLLGKKKPSGALQDQLRIAYGMLEMREGSSVYTPVDLVKQGNTSDWEENLWKKKERKREEKKNGENSERGAGRYSSCQSTVRRHCPCGFRRDKELSEEKKRGKTICSMLPLTEPP